jgi:hypothetical protein
MISVKMRILTVALLVQAGCSVTQRAPQDSIRQSGFLTNNDQLAPTNDKDLAAQIYVDKTANWTGYFKVRTSHVLGGPQQQGPT